MLDNLAGVDFKKFVTVESDILNSESKGGTSSERICCVFSSGRRNPWKEKIQETI